MKVNIIEYLKKLYQRKVYSESTGYLLNAFTLRISDKRIAAQVRKRQYTSFNDIYVYGVLGCIMSTTWAVYHYLVG